MFFIFGKWVSHTYNEQITDRRAQYRRWSTFDFALTSSAVHRGPAVSRITPKM
jgi:hypothetical protein